MKLLEQLAARGGGCVFDCDGTLVDSEPVHAMALQTALQEHGITLSVEELVRRFAGVDNPSIIRRLNAAHGTSIGEVFLHGVEQRTLALMASHAAPMAHAEGLLRRLARAAVPMAVASNSTRPLVEAALAGAGLAGYFGDRIVSREQVARPKPAPDLYLAAAHLLKRDPRRCLAIDDSEHGVRAAVAAGMCVLGYAGRPDAAASLAQAGAHHVVSDLAQVLELTG